jgi:hypothetical protein
MTMTLKEARINSIGIEKLDLIATTAVVYTDADGDGNNDTFTVTQPTTVTNPDDIAIYFKAADRIDTLDVTMDRWRIQPVQVIIAGGNATITGRAWQMVLPTLYEGIEPAPVDIASAGNFAADVDVYHRYTYAGTTLDTAQSVLYWESRPYPLFTNSYPTTTTDPSDTATYYARVAARDFPRGVVGFGEAVYNTTSSQWGSDLHLEWWRPPDRIVVRYNAGIPLVNGLVDKRYRTMISRFAAAELSRPICSCDAANRELYRWQFDLARSGGAGGEAYGAIAREDLDNPFGTCRGHVFAWHECKNLMQWRGVSF